MRNVLNRRWGWVFSVFLALAAHAANFEATLDQSNIVVNMDPPTVLRVTLRNNGSAPVYLTGIGLSFSDGIDGAIYDPTLFQDKLRSLSAGESWDGPLVVVRPTHRGPLLVKGFIHVKGGSLPTSIEDLAAIPLALTINDPRRQSDGSYDPSAVPACDRNEESCCDLSEHSCFSSGPRCIYIAEGYDRQNLCINQTADKTYERVFDLQVSSDGQHMAYLAGTHCLAGGPEVHCARSVIFDHHEQPTLETPSLLQLSPDGRHYAYLGRAQCVWRYNHEICSGPSHPVLDGVRVDAPPAWYHTPAAGD